jgi:hypothetical protein
MEANEGGETVTMSASRSSLDTAVIQALETATGESAMNLPPLYESVEVDALKKLIVDRDCEVRVEFEHAGCNVQVDGDTVTVEPT